MREAHEEDESGYTSEGGYTLQAYSEYSLSDNDERCGYLFTGDEDAYASDRSQAGHLADLPRPRVGKSDDKKCRARQMARCHTGLFGTCDEWPAEEFMDHNDFEKFAKEMANHIIDQQDTAEVEEFLFAAGDRNVLSKTRNIYLRRSKTAKPRPVRKKEDNFCLTAYVDINGHKAFALFDSGCTTDTCSPDFARISEMKVFPLESAINLQLGTAGSRSKINYGATALVKYGSIKSEEYLDVVNLDRFDAIIGTKYMRKHGISLDFEKNTIRIRGTPAPTLSAMEETAEVERRNAARYASKSE
jgi:hypothetical protein